MHIYIFICNIEKFASKTTLTLIKNVSIMPISRTYILAILKDVQKEHMTIHEGADAIIKKLQMHNKVQQGIKERKDAEAEEQRIALKRRIIKKF